MARETQFCKVLPALQSAIAIFFGGWGLWIRNSILSRPFLGESTGWDSTLRFHVWPWPLKFAAILNLPALLAGAIVSSPLGYFNTRFSAWAWTLPTLLCVCLLWYWVGRQVDKNLTEPRSKYVCRTWILFLLFILVSAMMALTDEPVGSRTTWVLFGIGIWLLIGMAIPIFQARRP